MRRVLEARRKMLHLSFVEKTALKSASWQICAIALLLALRLLANSDGRH
jgi:hypothetical protein